MAQWRDSIGLILHPSSQVLLHGPNEKFLIFSESPAILAFIAEAFDLFKIKYLQFSSSRRGQSVATTFETSADCRVLLMELKYGARGL